MIVHTAVPCSKHGVKDGARHVNRDDWRTVKVLPKRQRRFSRRIAAEIRAEGPARGVQLSK